MNTEKELPLSRVTLVFGALSIPLAFLAQLCVPALIMGVLAVLFHLIGRRRVRRGATYTPRSLSRSRRGMRLAVVGTALATTMWVLWATGALLN